MVTTAKKARPTRLVPAGEFKAKCLALMDRVAQDGSTITITKHGKPAAVLSAPEREPSAAFGFAKDDIEIVGDIVSPLDVQWDADS